MDELVIATADEVMLGTVEYVAAFLTNPVIASLLFASGVLGVLATIRSRQIGIATGLGLGALALFFCGHYLAGSAGWEGLVLVVLGLVLLGVELTIAPGFAIAGVSGVIALLGGLFLSVLRSEATTRADLYQALFTVSAAVAMLLAGGAVVMSIRRVRGSLRGIVPRTRPGRRQTRAPLGGAGDPSRAIGGDGPEPEGCGSFAGARGQALSDLDPDGVALVEGEPIDVVAQGDCIAAGEAVELVGDDKHRRVVRRVEPGEGRGV